MARTSVSAGAVAVAAFWGIAVMSAATLPMTDPDTWWHIRVGREILGTGAVPDADSWSVAGAGRPWVSQDWLSNVLMALLHAAGGASAVSLAYGLVAVVAMLLLWNAIGVRAPAIGWLGKGAWLLLGLVLAAPVLGARVQVVDLLLGAAVINVLWRYVERSRAWHLAALPVIAAAWANLHAGWPLLFLFGGAVVVGELVDRRVPDRPSGAVLSGGRLVPLMAALVVAAAALALNPNGIAIYTYPFDTLGLETLAAFVGEWQPARLSAPAGQLLAVFVVIGLLPALLVGVRYLRAADVLVLVGLAFMATTAVRFLLVAGPIGAAIVCLALAPAVSASRAGRASGGTLRRLSRRPSGAPGILYAALLVLVLVAGTGLTLARVSPAAQRTAIRDAFPVNAVEWLRENAGEARVFNRYEWGGYLGLQRPDAPVFIDGRADVYGDAIIGEYVEVISANADPGAYLDRHDIDHVLYPAESTLGRWLKESPEWRLAYADEVAAVWSRR